MVTIPPFCPNAACRYHYPQALRGTRKSPWYHKDGYYHSTCHGTVQRFVCTCCGTRFSAQTFSLDYGVKKRLSNRRIFQQVNSGSGIRFAARNLKVSEKVIVNRIARLARQAIAMHALLRELFSLAEELAADGFESFTGSQYFPNNIHLAVGKGSQYLYGADYAHLRRKGRMTPAQKQRRMELEEQWKAPPGEIIRSFTRLVRQIGRYQRENPASPLWLYTDEKQEYWQVLADVAWIRQVTVPSTAPRTLRNHLFPVNYFDRELRKDQSNHTRETVEFSRDVNNAMDRVWMYSAYHNYVKPYRIGVKEGEETTHAEQAGIPPEVIAKLWKTFFTRRFFVSHLNLSESEWRSWYRCYATPMKYTAPRYPRYADA